MNEIKKYLDLIQSMTLDCQNGKIGLNLYLSNIEMIRKKMVDIFLSDNNVR